MNNRRWKATWYENGHLREFIFYAPESRALARIDLQLKLIERGMPVPHTFELEEGNPVVCVNSTPE